MALAAPCALAGAQEPGAHALSPIVVSATREASTGFDLPLSFDTVGVEQIRYATPMVDLSESLGRVPGVVVRNRQNYAQDLQISSRGFGARSTFGVRGVRLYVDGIPATMPDGQGQTSNFDLASAERIEVLRGPFSALYGNSSGGVISLFTEAGKPGLHLEPFAQWGSYGRRRFGVKLSGESGSFNHVTSVSRFETDGYRPHSAARRDIGNVKLRISPDDESLLTIVGNAVRMPGVQDPLGLTRAQFDADPRSTHPNALLYNTRKSVRQTQLGLTWERFIGERDVLAAMVYAGGRSTDQVLPVPPAAQAAPTSAGGVIDLQRDYGGLDLRWTRTQSDTLEWVAGISADTLEEDRRGYENFAGDIRGVRGNLRRNERNTVRNLDQYIQLQWEPDLQWLVLAGVRNSRVTMKSRDRYTAPGNGDDSGAVRYRSVNPVLGATWRASDDLHVYASFGRGFETPTLNELSYRPGDGGAAGFNFDLQSAKSRNVEVGVKARLQSWLRMNAAAFHVTTDNELTVLSSTGGRAIYRNAGQTRRRGVELGVEGDWTDKLGARLAWSWLEAEYANAFCSGPCAADTLVSAGNRIPGVPRQTAYAELTWRDALPGMTAALELQYVGEVFVNDVNTESAPSHLLANLWLGFEQKNGPWQFRQFLRIDNLAGRRHVGSVIVNEGNGRYYEPGPGRNAMAGVSAVYSW